MISDDGIRDIWRLKEISEDKKQMMLDDEIKTPGLNLKFQGQIDDGGMNHI